jgi:hypothetical protein
MFSVKWLERSKESNPVEFENSILTELDRVVSSSQGGGTPRYKAATHRKASRWLHRGR